jgi:hypothetical protein
MLEAFLRLDLASDQQIQAYALRWGILGICKHELPFGWPPHTGEGKSSGTYRSDGRGGTLRAVLEDGNR